MNDNSRVFLLRQLWIVNYSIKSSSNNLSNENIKHRCFCCLQDKTWTIFENIISLETPFLCFYYWDYLTNFWRNNWWPIINIVERLSYCALKICHFTEIIKAKYLRSNRYYQICEFLYLIRFTNNEIVFEWTLRKLWGTFFCEVYWQDFYPLNYKLWYCGTLLWI